MQDIFINDLRSIYNYLTLKQVGFNAYAISHIDNKSPFYSISVLFYSISVLFQSSFDENSTEIEVSRDYSSRKFQWLASVCQRRGNKTWQKPPQRKSIQTEDKTTGNMLNPKNPEDREKVNKTNTSLRKCRSQGKLLVNYHQHFNRRHPETRSVNTPQPQ